MLTTTTTILPSLLRGCVEWRDDRPWIDNDALLVVADWCEENGRDADAAVIRSPFEFDRGFASVGKWHVRITSRFEALAVRGGKPKGDLSNEQYERIIDQYRKCSTFTPETPYQPISGEMSGGNLGRIQDLARWDLVCHMLGYPPIRLHTEQ